MANENAQALLHGRECPYGYDCLAVDCLECMEMHEEGSGEAWNSGAE